MSFIGVTEAAKIARTTRTRIYAAIRRGELIPQPDLPVVLLRLEHVEEFAKKEVLKGGRPRRHAADTAWK